MTTPALLEAANRFRHLHPGDGPAVLPEGYTAPMSDKPTRVLIRERVTGLPPAPPVSGNSG